MYMNDGNKTKINLRNKSVFITGVAGFIGSNLAKRLLSTVEGVKVVGLDNMNHYYDVRLKEARLNELEQFDNFSFVKGNLADKAVIESIFEQYKPEIVVNLGAQAGVRYSITNPDAYVEANLIGFYNILEACRHSYDEGHTPVEHLVYASSSSVSSIYNYECGCDELKKLYEIMADTDGIYGGRFSGAGFKGCCMALIDPDKAEDIEAKVTAEYLKAFPALEGKYSFHLCESADGVEL